MSLLSLEHVSKTYGRPPHAAVALKDVSLCLDPGEMAAVWGTRRSGRSTLLRVAAGIEAPDTGTVCLEGRSLHGRKGKAAGTRIAYCHKALGGQAAQQTILDELLDEPLAYGTAPALSASRVHGALERSGADKYARLKARELDTVGRARVAIARALLRAPRVLVIDEPTLGMVLRQREEIVGVLRALADDGIAVLYSTDSSTGFLGADRSLCLDRGSLRGEITPELADVVPLRKLA